MSNLSDQNAPTRPHAPIRRSAPVRPNARSNDLQDVAHPYDWALRILRGILAIIFFCIVSYLTHPILGLGLTIIFYRLLNRWIPSNQGAHTRPNARINRSNTRSNDLQGVVRGFKESRQILPQFNYQDKEEQRRKKEERMKAAFVVQQQRNSQQQNIQRNMQQQQQMHQRHAQRHHQPMHKPSRGPGHR